MREGQPVAAVPAIPATGGRCSPSSEICIRKFQLMPTSTPGMGPKWLEATLVQVLFLPVQAKPFPQSLVPPSFVPAANFFLAILLLPPTMSSSFLHSEQNHSSSSPSPASQAWLLPMQARWKAQEHSSHMIWLLGWSLPPHFLHPHSRHFLPNFTGLFLLSPHPPHFSSSPGASLDMRSSELSTTVTASSAAFSRASTWVQVCTVQVCRGAGVQVCRCAGVQGAGVQGTSSMKAILQSGTVSLARREQTRALVEEVHCQP